jgi:hypothetical protein
VNCHCRTQQVKDEDGDGVLQVNGKRYGDFATIHDLITACSTTPLPDGWPVLLTETVDAETGAVILMGPSLPRPVGAVWFHGVTKGKESDNESLRDSATGTFIDGRFFVAELGRDSKSFPG